jgi:acyl-CoA thioester hydrolase
VAIDIPVERRFKDLDPLNHVSNATFLDYIMEARVRMYLAIDPDIMRSGNQVVARQEINYRAPIEYSTEPLVLRTWVSHIGTTSFTTECQIWDGGALAADAKTVVVCFDIGSQKPIPIPEDFRAGLTSHYVEQPQT